ncbi:DUF998 domain-containing protein [Herbidospora mongoliensis]|uniref:DUF998 domain-containing protein n=1 Tax=Herbidospora mongoliensis TaxID=688067 RepID=UPI0008299591|nr:DUF998 domain-containing protein [Herbidospora mongoliensis]
MTAVAVTAPSTTRTLLVCAAVVGPLWSAVSLTQAATREGFDLTRHPLSLLSTGSLGWLQIGNFVVAGLLILAGAAGFRRVLDSAWVPRLVAASGAGMIAAGVFTMDPGDGFPVGTPAGPGTLGLSGIGHMAAGSITFFALIATCYVLGRHFSRAGDRRAAVASRVAGTALLAGDLWAMSGGKAGSLTLAVGAISAMLWVSWVAARHLRTV